MESVVDLVALAAWIFVWWLVAKQLSNKGRMKRHAAGCFLGLFALIVIVNVALSLGLISPGPEEPAGLEAQRRAAAAEKKAALVAPYEEAKQIPLSEAREFSVKRAKAIAVAYAVQNDVPDKDQDAFYQCFGHLTRTKGSDLPIRRVMEWCLRQYGNDRESFLAEHAKYDYFAVMEQFSRWDGSHAQTEAFIKAGMNDPGSYKHVQTRFNIQPYNTPPDMIVLTTFRGKNVFGAVVTNTVKVRVDLRTGQVLEVVD